LLFFPVMRTYLPINRLRMAHFNAASLEIH
jgi:hypothetical protein